MTPVLRLGSERCMCDACKQFFSTTRNFDAHRVGPHDDGTRRCLTPPELEAKGYIEKAGVWVMNAERPEFLNASLLEKTDA